MKKVLRFLTLAVLLAAPWGGYFNQVQAQATLTVADGTATSEYVPVHGNWADAYLKCEFVYPATDLAAMDGMPISAMTFYLSTPASAAWTGTFQVFLKEVGSTTLSDWSGTADATIVYEGTLNGTGSTMTVTFDNEYDYGGGNLLVGVYQTVKGNYKSCAFYGITATGASGSGYNSSNLATVTFTQRNFIPKTTFTYTPPAGFCYAPTDLTATVTPGSGTIATLNWTAVGTETDWVVEYSTASDFTGAASVNVSGTPTANLTGLTAETQYYARVKADCGGGDVSDWSTTVTFTPSNAYTITVNDGATTNGYVPVYGFYVDNYSYSQFIIPAASLSSIQWASLNQMTFYATQSSINWGSALFEVYVTEVDYTTFTGTTLVDWTTMTKVMNAGSLSVSGNQMVVTFDTPYQYTGGNLMIGVKQTVSGDYVSSTWRGVSATGASLGGYGSSISQQNFLPKVTFSYIPGAAPTCPKPTDLTVDPLTISAHDATLDWTENGTATQWQICLNGDEGNLVMANTTPYVLTTLDQDADYTVKVRAYCDASDQSAWSNEVNFHTLVACPAPTALTATNITADGATLGWTAPDPAPASGYNVRYRTAADQVALFFDDFESGLTQWTTLAEDYDNASTNWRQFDGSFSTPIPAHGGTYMAMSRSYDGDDQSVDNWLISPQVTLDGTLRFWARNGDGAGYNEHYDIYVSTTGNDISDFTLVYTPADADVWTEFTVDLSSYAGALGYIAIRHNDYGQDFLLIDDFGIYGTPVAAGSWTNTTSATNSLAVSGLNEQTTYDFEVQSNCGGETSTWVASTFTTLPNCMPVTNLAVASATTTTVTLSWDDNNAGAASYVVTDNADAAVTVTGLTTTGCTVTGLTANIAYTFKVKANCGGGYSSAEYIAARTECEAITALPYEEGFEGDGYYCWTRSGNFANLSNVNFAHAGTHSLYAAGDVADPQYAVLPATTDNISNLMLNFWYRNYYSYYDCGTLNVGYLIDPADFTTFVTVESIDMTSAIEDYVQTRDYTFEGAPAGSRIALEYNGTGVSGDYVMIDDVTVAVRPACMVPYDLAVDPASVDAHGATLTWGSNASAWEVSYSEHAADSWSTPAAANTASYTFTGLTPETAYDVRVRSNCDVDGYSDWVTLANAFTTDIACFAPTALAASNITNHTADVAWTGTAAGYNVKYRTAAYVNGTEETFATSSIPTGWTRYSGLLNNVMGGTALTTTSSGWTTNTYALGTYNLKVNIYGSSCNYWAVTPATTLDANAVLSFDLALTAFSSANAASGTRDDDRFVVLISADDMATWTILREWNNSGSSYVYNNIATAGENVNIDLSAYDGQTVKIAFYGESTVGSNGDNDLHIDNVAIGTAVAAGGWINTTTTNPTVSLDDLRAERKYEVQVQSDCDADGISAWATMFFTTDIPCATPTALAYAELKSDRVNLSWNSSASDWQVYVYNVTSDAEVGTIDVTSSEVSIVGTTITYTLESLDPETEYTVKVRNNCEASYPGDGLSEWTTTVNFTTLESCGQPINVTVTDITNNSASVNWTGDAPSFTVKYRIPAHIDGVEESFGTSLPSGWENKTGLLSSVMTGTALSSSTQWSFGTNNGVFDNHARINIYGTSRYGWLISPTFTLPDGATMSFDLALTAYSGTLVAPATTGTDDRFVVLVYSDDAWHILREWNNSGSPYVYNDIPNTAAGETVDDIDISAYVGKNVKFAFYGESTVSNADNNLHIDNVVIGKPVDAGVWASLDPTAATNNSITGLTPETGYEVVVVPSCNTSLVSDAVTFTTLAGITKDISANEWYAIASPTHNSGNDMTVAGVANLTSDTYDLMRYNESSGKWESQKADPGLSQAGFTTLERGRGYIYRRSTNTTLTFVGQRNTGNISRSITHSCGDLNIKGFNLVGNPYGVTYASTNFYTLEPNGMWTVHTTGTVAAGEAFFVYETSNNYYNFTQPSGAKSAPRSNAATIAFMVSNDDYSDVAYARFADGEGMPKMAHLNSEAPALSIPQGDRRYAIANLDENTESFPLHFSGFGEYTFSLSDNSLGLGYLHLVDRETGADVDMLRQSGYTFSANGNESERFVVLLRPTADANSFVRVSDSRLVVDGEGELQVFDVMGRQLGSAQVSGTTTLDRSSLGIVSAGVYVMRLDGNSQKIVVK